MKTWFLLFFFLLPLSLKADGGAVQFRRETGKWNITLFSEPSPLRAGPADLSVLVQNGTEPILDAALSIQLEYQDTSGVLDWRPPCCSMNGGSGKMTLALTHEKAANKLLYSAMANLPYSGNWKVTITGTQNGENFSVEGEMMVQKSVDPWVTYLPYMLIPVFGIGVFAMLQRARAAKNSKRVHHASRIK